MCKTKFVLFALSAFAAGLSACSTLPQPAAQSLQTVPNPIADSSPSPIVTDEAAPTVQSRMPAAVTTELIRIANYSQPVAIVRSTNQPRTMIIHFHGIVFNTPRDRNLSAIVRDMEFERLLKSHPEAMIVVPGSSGKNATYSNDLKYRANFEAFVSKVLESQHLTVNNIEQIIVTGHSMAYQVVGRFLRVTANSELGDLIARTVLFDATYKDIKPTDYLSWMGEAPLEHCLQVVYRTRTPTQEGAMVLRQGIGSQVNGLPEGCHKIIPADANINGSSDHWKLVPAYFNDLVFQ